MTRRLAGSALLALVALVTGSSVLAQEEGGLFQPGANYAGPRLWLGNLNGALAFGGQVERAFTEPGASGPGIIGGGAGIDFYTWSHDYGFGSYKYSVIPIQAFGNYHFVIQSNRKLDPYLGLALVYSIVSASWDGTGTPADAEASWFALAGQAGLRYFMSNNLALQAGRLRLRHAGRGRDLETLMERSALIRCRRRLRALQPRSVADELMGNRTPHGL